MINLTNEKVQKFISENLGHLLLRNFHDKLTIAQKQLAFENAIKNNQGRSLLEYCYEKLTEEQIELIINSL